MTAHRTAHVAGRRAWTLAVVALSAIAWTACGPSTQTSSSNALGPESHASFPIGAGSVHEKVDCSACHGEFDTFTQFTCHSSGCHAETETTPLHTKAPGYEYVSGSCYLCHPRGIKGAAVDHTLDFPIDKGTSHQNTSCSVCHTQPGTPEAVTCATGTCHSESSTDATHPDSLGYVWGASTCLTCHPNGKVGTVDHAALFPIRKGETHGDVACVTCHQDASNYPAVTCMTGGCHDKAGTDNWHSDVVGYEYQAKSCLGCHPNSQTNLVDHKRFFPIAPGDVHGDQSCGSCHSSADRKQVSCTDNGCHARGETNGTHGAVLGYEYLSKSCLSCHPSAKTNQRDHVAFFPIQGGTPHADVACASCHRDPVSRKPVTCIGSGCHVQAATDPIHASFPNYTFGSSTCLNCHLGGKKQLDHSFFPTQAGTSHAGIACTQCHASPADRHVLNCANAPCHDPSVTSGKHVEVGGYQWESTMCVRCHGDGKVPRVADHLPFGVASDFPHYQKPCLQCHPSTRLDRPALADFTIRNCFSAGCHIRTAVSALHAVVAPGGYKPDPVTCIQSGCHENGRKP